mgnify:FL=1
MVTFYLSAPPRERSREHDFRTLTREVVPEDEALLSALLRNVHGRQELVRAALEEAEEGVSTNFVGSMERSVGIEAAAQRVRETINFGADDFRRERGLDQAFSALRGAVE